MIEESIRNYLLGKFDIPVYLDIPAEPKLPYIAIERTGRSVRNRINEAVIAVQSCSANSLYEAACLAGKVDEAMDKMPDTEPVYGCHLNSGPYNFTDSTTKTYRYQAIYNITY